MSENVALHHSYDSQLTTFWVVDDRPVLLLCHTAYILVSVQCYYRATAVLFYVLCRVV